MAARASASGPVSQAIAATHHENLDLLPADAALADVSLHCHRVRTRLYELATAARSLYSDCIGRVALGSPATQIVRQSQALRADLIAVPLPLDLIRWCCLPEELLDELVRTADCPVLCAPARKFHPEELPTADLTVAPSDHTRSILTRLQR